MAKQLPGNMVQIEAGDTLGDIAVQFCNDYNQLRRLAAINKIKNPNLIYVGQTIKLESTVGPAPAKTPAPPSKITDIQFGVLSTDANTLFATWSWSRADTESYKVMWYYDPGNGVWFVGTNTTNKIDTDDPDSACQSLYTIPSNARRVKFKVKPMSKTKKSSSGAETSYWTASWSEEKQWTDSTPLATPSVPSVAINMYKLTATLDNVKITGATGIEFEVYKNNAAKKYKSQKVTITSAHASHVFDVEPGGEYKVRCRAYDNSKNYSEWTDYSNNEGTMPATPSGAPTLTAVSETSVRLEWTAADTADSYDIEYATKKGYFDSSDMTEVKSGIKQSPYEINGLESGQEYFFRVRAVNAKGNSGWSGINSIIIGKSPAAPTTWSSTTTAIVGESLTLSWVHNTEDGSSQLYAELEVSINGVTISPSITIENLTDKENKDKTRSCSVDTANGYIRWIEDDGEHQSYLGKSLTEGTTMTWRVRTAGITKEYGDWSIQRTIDIYARPRLQLSMTELDGSDIDVLTTFPFYIYGLPDMNTNQTPIGYHLTVTANEIYETTDRVGNTKFVNAGDSVYSKYFDTRDSLLVEFSANNIDLENNIEYTVTCTLSMDSGLTTDTSLTFTVNWTDLSYTPDAEIGIDEESLTASIRPYCSERVLANYRVVYEPENTYTVTDELLGLVYGTVVPDAKTDTGELVYSGVTENGDEVYYCSVEEVSIVDDALLSVYRREFDGSFTELATGLDSSQFTTVTDPHPALDYARYRIVAVSKTTGAVNYYDPPGYPVGGKAVVIQWDEDWTNFDTTEESELAQPPWSGSMLKLPYNIKVSDDYDPDVSLVNYIGRKHPVGYYGTHLGEKSTWNVDIDKEDKETLYALRRLAIWMDNVYVREPSGSGYWASIKVSFGHEYDNLTIPVTFSITRVEGGM